MINGFDSMFLETWRVTCSLASKVLSPLINAFSKEGTNPIYTAGRSYFAGSLEPSFMVRPCVVDKAGPR